MSIYLEFPPISEYPVFNPATRLLTYLEVLVENLPDTETRESANEVLAITSLL